MRFAKRTDQNHVEIVTELRKRGIYARNLTTAGDGIADVVTHYRGKVVFMEIKFGKTAKMKKTQMKFLGSWPGYCGIARTVDEAVNLAMEPERYAFNQRQKDNLLIAHSRTEGKEAHLQTILQVISR
jgi:hypothetical protein